MESEIMASTATSTKPTSSAPPTFQAFIDSLKDQGDALVPVLSPKRFSEALDMDLQTLAEQAHVHRNTLARAPNSRAIQDFLRQALRVIKAATDLNGNVGTALFWYRNEPLAPFGYKTAEQLVADGRADDLLDYIASLEAGAVG